MIAAAHCRTNGMEWVIGFTEVTINNPLFSFN